MTNAASGASLVRLVLVSFLVTGVLIAVGWFTTRSRGEAAVSAVLWGCLIPLAGSLVGSIPFLWPAATAPAATSRVLGSMLIRLLVVASGAVAVTLFVELPSGPFVVWLLVAYLSLLAVDTAFTFGRFRSL